MSEVRGGSRTVGEHRKVFVSSCVQKQTHQPFSQILSNADLMNLPVSVSVAKYRKKKNQIAGFYVKLMKGNCTAFHKQTGERTID